MKLADKTLEIPMFGEKESLNVAVAFGIVAFGLRFLGRTLLGRAHGVVPSKKWTRKKAGKKER
jgi:hypothetical protein